MNETEIRTSSRDWLKESAKAYKSRKRARLIDDAGLGIDPSQQSLFDMGQRADLSMRDWVGVLVALGLGGAGIWMVRLAFLDPEPTSKLWLLVSGGCLALLTGGGMAIWILTDRRPPTVRSSPKGFEFSWA